MQPSQCRSWCTAPRVLALILWQAGGVCAAAQTWVSEYPQARAQATQSCKQPIGIDCQQALRKLAQLLDGRIDIVHRMAQVNAALGLKAESLANLELYARSRVDLGDPQLDPAFAPLRATPRFAALERRYKAGILATGSYRQLATIPDVNLIAEDLGVDPRDGARYVSSVHTGAIWKLDAAGHWSVAMAASDLSAWGAYALAIDASRDRIWIGSVAGAVSPPYQSSDSGRSVILRVGLREHGSPRRYELHDGLPHAFGDMALGEHGEVYVSDGVGGGVYRIGAADEAQLEVLCAPGQMRSPQTPVVLPGGQRLLVPDYARGIAIVTLSKPGEVSWLPHPPELALYGIDGMYLRGHTLIAIQNGTVPERLLLLHLDAALSRVTSWTVALSGAAGLGDPTHGVVRGDRFEFISKSGWDRVADDGGLAKAGASNPAIWSIALPTGN
jgi:hypothetical protein